MKIFDDKDHVVETVYMMMINRRLYLAYTHYGSKEIRTYRTYYPGDNFDVAWNISSCDRKPIDWIEIISMKNRQIVGGGISV